MRYRTEPSIAQLDNYIRGQMKMQVFAMEEFEDASDYTTVTIQGGSALGGIGHEAGKDKKWFRFTKANQNQP